MTRDEIDAFEDKCIENIYHLENEFYCNDRDEAAYEVERAEVRYFCAWARSRLPCPPPADELDSLGDRTS